MKKIIQLLILLITCMNLNAQMIPLEDLQNLVKNDDVSELVNIMRDLGYNLEHIKNANAGEKGLAVPAKVVYWSYNCRLDKDLDKWMVDMDKFWGYVRLIKKENGKTILDFTVNINFGNEYVKNIDKSLRLQGFQAHTELDEKSNSIFTYYTKDDYNYTIIIEQTRVDYTIYIK